MSLLVVDRYIFVECVKAWLGVTVVLLVLTLGIGFAQFVAEAAAGNIPVGTVFTIASFSLIENLGIILPVSLMLAIMLTVGGLCSRNEMAALIAGGVGLGRLYRPFGLFAILLVAVAGWVSLYVAPTAVRSIKQIENVSSVALMQVIEAGQFTVLDGGNLVFYAGAVDTDTGHMSDIFVRIRGRGDDRRGTVVVTAQTAVQERDPESGVRTLVLRDGWRYQGIPGQANFRVTRFAEYGVRIQAPTGSAQVDDIAATPTMALLGRDDPAALAELQRRLSAPLMLLILTLLAVPLGYVSPRSGRYGKLVLGILIYVAYANALRLAEVWIKQSVVPPVVGMWWVHAIVLGLAIALIGRWEGWWRRNTRPA